MMEKEKPVKQVGNRQRGTFTSGDSRINRKGRPKKGQSLTDILNWELDQKRTFEDGDKTGTLILRHLLAKKIIEKAIDNGDVFAMKYIYDRIDGKPRETVDATVQAGITGETLDKLRAIFWGNEGCSGGDGYDPTAEAAVHDRG
jgi:hypothetical protein